MSRVRLVRQPEHSGDIETLVSAAGRELAGGENKNAAELLRAAEHLCFAALASENPGNVKMSRELIAAILDQLGELEEDRKESAGKEIQQDADLAHLVDEIAKAADKALAEEQYHRAPELKRAVVSLSLVKLPRSRKLKAGEEIRQLAAS